MRATRARCYANFNHHHPSFLLWQNISYVFLFLKKTSKLVAPQFLLFTLLCFSEKSKKKNFPVNFQYVCLHAVAGFATHCANHHGALHPVGKVWSIYVTIFKYIQRIFCLNVMINLPPLILIYIRMLKLSNCELF